MGLCQELIESSKLGHNDAITPSLAKQIWGLSLSITEGTLVDFDLSIFISGYLSRARFISAWSPRKAPKQSLYSLETLISTGSNS